jgi:hypothetical protein
MNKQTARAVENITGVAEAARPVLLVVRVNGRRRG